MTTHVGAKLLARQPFHHWYPTGHRAVGFARDLGVTLADHHWRLLAIGVESTCTAPGWFVGQTPAGQITRIYEVRRPRGLAEHFAAAVGHLAREPRAHSALADLQAALGAHGVHVINEPVRARFDPIPGLGLIDQPRPAVTAGYWYALPLVNCRWFLSHLGEDIAQGGYIAEIPGGHARIIPADTPDDGTPATALARLMPMLNPTERVRLCQLVNAAAAPARVVHPHSPAHMVRLKVVDALRRRR